MVVERHQLRLHRIIYRLVGHPEDAAELTQQGFLAAFTALGRFDPVYPFSPWLVRIGVNLAKDHLKSSRRRELPDAPDEIDGRELSTLANPERSVAGSESRRQLARALVTLSLADREILVLKDVEELSYEEIRTILHRPITALKIRALRARVACASRSRRSLPRLGRRHEGAEGLRPRTCRLLGYQLRGFRPEWLLTSMQDEERSPRETVIALGCDRGSSRSPSRACSFAVSSFAVSSFAPARTSTRPRTDP